MAVCRQAPTRPPSADLVELPTGFVDRWRLDVGVIQRIKSRSQPLNPARDGVPFLQPDLAPVASGWD